MPDLASLDSGGQVTTTTAEGTHRTCSTCSDPSFNVDSGDGMRAGVLCPREGDSAEFFSRLVRAKTR